MLGCNKYFLFRLATVNFYFGEFVKKAELKFKEATQKSAISCPCSSVQCMGAQLQRQTHNYTRRQFRSDSLTEDSSSHTLINDTLPEIFGFRLEFHFDLNSQGYLGLILGQL